MRRFSGLAFILLYSLLLFRPVLPYVEYAINKAYIAEVLCVNKGRPQLKCDGKCYLAAQLEKAVDPQPQDATVPAPPVPKFEELLVWQRPVTSCCTQVVSGTTPACALWLAGVYERDSLPPPTPPPQRFS
ncbi:MAG: hypothetical protein D6722_23005 [Bacteroidetes bacterium]|nr:MAG: hypothetical protein D6722_23005 [Bacteroidota bacterium]